MLVTKEGEAPFLEWLESFENAVKAITAVRRRIVQARLGNLGDWKSVGGNVNEMRIDVGPGYRVYFAIHRDQVIILLSGGIKSTQSRDIEKAVELWKEYKDDVERFRRDY